MTRIETHANETPIPALSAPAGRRSLARAASLFNRPIPMCLLALLAILGSCQTYGRSVAPSYDSSRYDESTLAQATDPKNEADPANSAESNAVPLLFLTFVGLAGMALSRTGPSHDDRH